MKLGHIVALDFEENVRLRPRAFTPIFLLYSQLQTHLSYHLSREKMGLYCHLYREAIVLLTRQILS